VQWYTPVISALGRLRQEDVQFKSSLGYILRSCLKKTTKRATKENYRGIIWVWWLAPAILATWED
jgi:hypothetical protein